MTNSIKANLLLFLFLLLTTNVCVAQERTVQIPNGDSEQGLDRWLINEKINMTRITNAAPNGKPALFIKDTHSEQGSNAKSELIPVKSGLYEIRSNVYFISGRRVGLSLHLMDSKHQRIKTLHFDLRGHLGKWRTYRERLLVTEDTMFVQIWVHSYDASKVEMYINDIQLTDLGQGETNPPFKGQYKIRPNEREKLTAADLVGPDGLVYPDWRYAGVQGGIPDVPVKVLVADFGAKPNDQLDDSVALQKAVDHVGQDGGGAVLLDEGVYQLDWPVTVRHNGVVIRGQGKDKTRLIFRYDVPEPGITFYGLKNKMKVGKNSRIELHCKPKGLKSMQVFAGDKLIHHWERGLHSGNTFATSFDGRKLLTKINQGKCILRGVGRWRDGSEASCSLEIDADAMFNDPAPVEPLRSAITFLGNGLSGGKILLDRTGNRGDSVLTLKSVEGLVVGDYIQIDGPPTKRWKALTNNLCKWGSYRRNILKIIKIEGNNIHVNQPLRIDFPVIDSSFVEKIELLEYCGLEDLYFEQTSNLWITSSYFYNAANCWARGVMVKNCGRHPIYGYKAKWCEIRDTVFEDAWFKGGGGTAYAGWDNSWDCLTENLETFRMRHGPLFQWAASGNVIRNSIFHDSDGQWHSGWTHENLIEQCVIESKRGHGGYGFGLWASPPEDTSHGPNGPRNVVYNCTISSERTGLWMGGMNENWLILYNRFDVKKGVGIFAKDASFDHIIKGNTFILRDSISPFMTIMTADCIGIELIGNRVYGGNGELKVGLGILKADEENRFFPLTTKYEKIEPIIPSIFNWQRKIQVAR
jgi:hypothetical protein